MSYFTIFLQSDLLIASCADPAVIRWASFISDCVGTQFGTVRCAVALFNC